MTREQALEYIRNNPGLYLEKDKSGKGFICPICQSGTGAKGTGLTTKDGIHLTCWRGCFSSKDIIDIIGQQYEIEDFNGQLNKAAELFGINIDGQADFINLNSVKEKKQKMTNEAPAKHEENYKEFYKKAAQDINKTDYHRGLSDRILKLYSIGYVEAWKNPAAPDAPASKRLIIPITDSSYLARSTEQDGEYSKIKVGNSVLFNPEALEQDAQPIFVVEGEIDALSIIDAGGQAIGLGSTSNYKQFIELLEGRRLRQALLLALDNDETGRTTTAKIEDALKQQHKKYYVVNPYGEYKDANEALIKDRAQLEENVKAGAAIAIAEETKELNKDLAITRINEAVKKFTEEGKTFISTGFEDLDKALNGGISTGLYILGGLSSCGKTTFAMQMAEYMANQRKRPVVLFSLEMPYETILAKGISRLTRTIFDIKKKGQALTAQQILNLKQYQNERNTDTIKEATNHYGRRVLNYYYVKCGRGEMVTAKTIREYAQRVKDTTGTAPVVIIDYLQVLSPLFPGQTDKQNTDAAVDELIRLHTELDTAVIAISSLNRDNYYAPVSMESFKESGKIEYSSDVLLGLQYKGMDYEKDEKEHYITGDKHKARVKELIDSIQQKSNEDVIEMQLKILKSRLDRKGSIELGFYPAYNRFVRKEDNGNKEQDEIAAAMEQSGTAGEQANIHN